MSNIKLLVALRDLFKARIDAVDPGKEDRDYAEVQGEIIGQQEAILAMVPLEYREKVSEALGELDERYWRREFNAWHVYYRHGAVDGIFLQSGHMLDVLQNPEFWGDEQEVS